MTIKRKHTGLLLDCIPKRCIYQNDVGKVSEVTVDGSSDFTGEVE